MFAKNLITVFSCIVDGIENILSSKIQSYFSKPGRKLGFDILLDLLFGIRHLHSWLHQSKSGNKHKY